MPVTYDAWQEVTTSDETAREIVEGLLNNEAAVIIGWTDGRSTHHDVLFTLSPVQYGSLQGGIEGPGYLFVSIMRIGAFAFDCKDGNELHPDYVGEKLHIRGEVIQLLPWRTC